jgi:hypothetical protein
MKLLVLLVAMLASLSGCGNSAFVQDSGFNSGLKIGSATSKNLFIDSSQFANRVVKLRIRNSSGDPALDIGSIRSRVEAGLRSAGYEISDKEFGIVIDVNAYFMNSVASGRGRASNEIGALLGGVAGYEMAKRSGQIGEGSGVILGAIAGATLQEVLRASNEYETYVALCDVNIGVIRQESRKKDYFTIGGNKIERQQEEEIGTFESFALRETVKVAVYAGDVREGAGPAIISIHDRLARIIANLI